MSDNHEDVVIKHLMTSRQRVNESARVRIVNVGVRTPYVWFKNLLRKVKVITTNMLTSHVMIGLGLYLHHSVLV